MIIDAYTVVGVDREYGQTAHELIENMDQTGVQMAVIAPPDRQLAVYNQEGNDEMLRLARLHCGRLVPTCTVNPWYGKTALAELNRALVEGARMLVLHPWVQGYVANDELVFPLVERAARERVPVYFHTGPHSNATPFQVMSVARRYPDADFIIGHCGATDFWYDVVAAARLAKNCYLESSLARPFNFANYLRQLEPARGIFGSFAPINGLAFELRHMRAALPPEAHELVLGGTMKGLLKKKGAL
jgi:uncharacterized protein